MKLQEIKFKQNVYLESDFIETEDYVFIVRRYKLAEKYGNKEYEVILCYYKDIELPTNLLTMLMVANKNKTRYEFNKKELSDFLSKIKKYKTTRN